MSGLTFKEMFADWEWLMREEGETEDGIDEIRQAIRTDWGDEEKRAWWHRFVAEKSAERRQLIAMARGISDRIKAQSFKEAA